MLVRSIISQQISTAAARSIRAKLEAARAARAPIVVVEAIKLIEAGYGALCDAVWLVTCTQHEQLARLVTRGLDPADARQRARAQAGMANRLAGYVTAVIDTSGALGKAEARVGRALAAARSGARRTPQGAD